MKHTVLGLDLSITSPGATWLRGGEDIDEVRVLHWINPKTTVKQGNDQQRFRWIWRQVLAGIDLFEPDLVVIERYALSKRTNQTRLGELGGVIRWELTNNGLLWCDLATSNAVKLLATGDGGADKDLMLRTARMWWPECPSVRPGEDVADSFHIARYGLAHYEDYLREATWAAETIF